MGDAMGDSQETYTEDQRDDVIPAQGLFDGYLLLYLLMIIYLIYTYHSVKY